MKNQQYPIPETEENIIGGEIRFKLEVWDDTGALHYKEYTSKVIRLVTDPLGYHEMKCLVNIDNKSYGIPESRILEFYPKHGYQFELF